MPDTTYNPTFKHVDWIDNEDVVQAGGENGFNARFHALEAEFTRLSTVIGNINASVSSTIALSFAPSLLVQKGFEWALIGGSAVKDKEQHSVIGWMHVQLPDGTQIQSMTAIGNKRGIPAFFEVQLWRRSLPGGEAAQLARISLVDKPDSFQESAQVPANLSLVDNSTNFYYVVAQCFDDGEQTEASLAGIQILCKRL